jgi:hypothetical protein
MTKFFLLRFDITSTQKKTFASGNVTIEITETSQFSGEHRMSMTLSNSEIGALLLLRLAPESLNEFINSDPISISL